MRHHSMVSGIDRFGQAKPAEADVTREPAGFTIFRLIIHITSIWPGSQAYPIKNLQIDSSSYIGCTLSGLKSPQGGQIPEFGSLSEPETA